MTRVDEPIAVGRAAEQLGVSVRTLHHWETLGLVTTARTAGGYRTYTCDDLARLHRVLRYRELGVPLADIVDLLGTGGDALELLHRQRAELLDRLDRTRRALAAVDRLIDATEHGPQLTPAEQVALFGDGWDPAWTAVARERWGGTDAWRQYAEHAADRTPRDWELLARDVAALEADLGAAKRADVEPGSPAADALAERHRASIAVHLDCSHARHVCLARRYTTEEGFRAHYDAVEPGLAAWLRAVVEANARAHGVDPDTATWS
ncbi:MerR family transcriptional regulator [Kineococcus rhizosphaerae]|uniref:DNA-binding transcriptional MerR regulator n=1 Tax=Kineococcus rhizosphaerae TaxID=559628 RepID=A0A2T0QWM7_9ACTN|nr:DNA-binding transcriptional MerR regulator [Kineococcus rhizosphaerae]